jgi:hypothetical protein
MIKLDECFDIYKLELYILYVDDQFCYLEFVFTAAEAHYQCGDVDTALQYIETLLKSNYSIQRIERSPELGPLVSKTYLQLIRQYKK